MPPRHVRNNCTRRNRLGNDLAFLLSAPAPPPHNARYFDVPPNDLRVVTDVDHNVHTILQRWRITIVHYSQPPGYVR